MRTPIQHLEPALQPYHVQATAAREIAAGFNQHYHVKTDLGDKHLIVFRPQAGRPPHDLQFDLGQHAREHGFDLLPRPVPALGGRSTGRTRLGTVALVDWVPGTPASLAGWSPKRLARASSGVLADLHQATREFRPPRGQVQHLSPLYLPADAWVDRAPTLLGQFREETPQPDAVQTAVAEQVAAACASFDPAAYREALVEGPGVVHGDYRPANLLVEEDAIVGVIDLDAAFWESRLYDLAYACLQFDGTERVYPQEDPEPAAAFVSGYVAGWPLSEAERALFPFFLRLVVLKRLLVGRDVEPRLALLEQLDAGLEARLLEAAGLPEGDSIN